jgi:hypothetical protein
MVLAPADRQGRLLWKKIVFIKGVVNVTKYQHTLVSAFG